ncbi:hypothetical protein, partial [Alistipes putredinis]|uniref:hypothetical protein n=1 Tax=Alistipes putredinis TaxID=28117 RepID=UPI003AB6D153
DMVCEKNSDMAFDFDKDPICAIIERRRRYFPTNRLSSYQIPFQAVLEPTTAFLQHYTQCSTQQKLYKIMICNLRFTGNPFH